MGGGLLGAKGYVPPPTPPPKLFRGQIGGASPSGPPPLFTPMDLGFYTLFNSISVISSEWEVDNERLCAKEPHLQLERFPLPPDFQLERFPLSPGLEPRTWIIRSKHNLLSYQGFFVAIYPSSYYLLVPR